MNRANVTMPSVSVSDSAIDALSIGDAPANVTRFLSAGEAQRLTQHIKLTASGIRNGLFKLRNLIEEAKRSNAWQVLGFSSWTAYLSDTLAEEPMRVSREERLELVGYLAGEGLSTRAIAPIVGVSHKTEFTASNGIRIDTYVDLGAQTYMIGRLGENPITGDGYTHVTASAEGIEALREYFQQQEDERLLRWRFNDHIVVYPEHNQPKQLAGRSVVVMDERTPRVFDVWEERTLNNAFDERETTQAARAFFDAHPVPKPAWHDAKPGEVWVLTTHGEEQPYCRASNGWEIVGRSYFILGDYITAGRRIWPDEPKQVAS